jgi:polyisoprenoid-binding protein YceI
VKTLRLILLLSILIAEGAFAQTVAVDAIKKETSITYRIVHPLHHIEATSRDVASRVALDPGKKEITNVTAQADVTTFDSGNSNRDSHAMEVIDAISYPDVMFTSTSVRQEGDSVAVTGKLTFHGVTQDVVIHAASKWSSNRLEIQGSFDVSLTAFKIERPALMLIPVEDKLSFTLNAVYGW